MKLTTNKDVLSLFKNDSYILKTSHLNEIPDVEITVDSVSIDLELEIDMNCTSEGDDLITTTKTKLESCLFYLDSGKFRIENNILILETVNGKGEKRDVSFEILKKVQLS